MATVHRGGKFTMVCRDCGEVVHVDLATVRPGSPIACVACGLAANPQHLRLPALPVPGSGARAPPPPRRPGPRLRR
jgi:hypothetical protein